MKIKRSVWLAVLCGSCFTMQAQYDPSKIFVNDFYNYKGNDVRSASGKPGNAYWQNEADYTVKASFDAKSLVLDGNVQIAYTNNSPDQLEQLWLQLDQNILNSDSRVSQLHQPGIVTDTSKGYTIKSVTLNGKAISFILDGTRMQIRLGDAIVKPGQKIKLAIDYSYILQPNGGGGRSGYVDTENGRIYEFSYWYPRMCVYDDYRGWNSLPFIGGGEMYLDYGNIDYTVTVPAGETVVGAGELLNGEDILSSKTLKRLKEAQGSDKTVMIHKASELKQAVTAETKGTVTWHFKMENTRDVAWAMSKAFVWDAAKINLPSGKTSFAQSVYPVEGTEKGRAWVRSTEFLKASIEGFSKRWFEYPYPTATSIGGPVGGMEFPGLAFNSYKAEPYDMFLLASHELGHTWFPMIVGSDERRHPFMDEGFNTFIDIYAHDDFNNGEFAPKRDGEYAPGKGNPADEIIKVIEDTKNGPTLMTPADAQDYKYVHPLSYFKSAFGLVLLREVILGHDKFNYAFRSYIKNWAFKHPKPEDFFKTMENYSGEDLTWFWNGWYAHNWQLDQAAVAITYTKDDAKNGAVLTVENKDQMVMPMPLKITESNGKVHTFTIPVEIWQNGAQAKINIPSTSKIKEVVIDPDHVLPDTDRSNNILKL
ncbi:M1 family metallopeptidase [Zhouia sp. PK063]|uniref:M1 family metallopeptidase n=1 Tax=Zhouia sp. PK063 TaxID=3373602 RepID=UPI0037B23700